MPRYCYVNGRFTPHRDGAVHIEDRVVADSTKDDFVVGYAVNLLGRK